MISGVDEDKSRNECESSESDEEDEEDDNVSYFGAIFLTNNHITFNDLDEIQKIVKVSNLIVRHFK